MPFPWLTPTRPSSPAADTQLEAQLREVRDRAALFYRLGYSAEDATARITSAIAWEHERRRPEGLSDAAIADAVRETFQRRPSGAF